VLVIPAIQGGIYRRIVVQAGPGIKLDLIPKITNTKGTGRVAQVEECLLSRHEAHVQYLVLPKKKKEKLL
jgi:hypothetical protein